MRSMVEGASELRTRSAQKQATTPNSLRFRPESFSSVEADAPSTALRAVPLPRFAGADDAARALRVDMFDLPLGVDAP